MPWRGPRAEREVPTLGWAVYDWICANCAIPDGEFRGDPFIPSEAQTRFLLGYYALHEDAAERIEADDRRRPSRAFLYPRGGILAQPQKAGKSPFGAAVACAEAAGPVRFEGWDANGEPVGHTWPTPLVVITAQSEEQAGNVWDALLPMVELGDLAAEISSNDSRAIGVTRINLPGGGLIVPVTASAKSRQGARATFVVQDEVQGWDKTNKGHKLADTQYRSLAGMGGRFLQICNAWDPSEESVAQRTWEHGLGVFKQMSEPGTGSIRNKRELDKMLRRVYAGSPHVDLERIKDEIAEYLSMNRTAEAERYFLNRIVPADEFVFDYKRWQELTKTGYQPEQGATIAVGVDGARYRDALAMIATEVDSGFQWPLVIMERPQGAPDDYEHDFDVVDGILIDAFERYNVERVYIDPGSQYANITPLMERWQGRWGAKRILEWLMTRPKPTGYMIRNYESAIITGDLSHDGDPTFARHIANARRHEINVYDDDNRKMHSIRKEHPMSPKKIDAAAAGALSWEARGDILANGPANVDTEYITGDTCNDCGHLRRFHTDVGCRYRPEGHCRVFAPRLEIVRA